MNKLYEAGDEPPFDAIARRTEKSISRGFEDLLFEEQLPLAADGTHFGVVIVGSGYGGAIAAAELSGYTAADCDPTGSKAPRNGSFSVCVLERGAEYLPGMFPSRLSEVAGHVRFSTPNSTRPQGRREGLFDVRLGEDVNALVANGLGGGSLINAGIMAVPADRVFADERWPPQFRDESSRKTWYAKARELLGAAADNTIYDPKRPLPKKFGVLEQLTKGGYRSGARFARAPLSMVMSGPPRAKSPFGPCIRCGDCATGCNHGAKNSLDARLLARAKRRGAKIYTGATVLRVVRDDKADGWRLDVVHTDEKLRKRHGEPFKLFAKKVILAAGTFGSTEILLRSHNPVLPFSSRVGQRFSSNGDAIAALYGHGPEANAIVDEATIPKDREVGPTITGMLTATSLRSGEIVIEELGIPGSLKRVCEELVSTANTLHTLEKEDTDPHTPKDIDPCAVDTDAMERTSFFALMGDDKAKGAIELVGGDGETEGDGAVRVRWPELRTDRLFEDQLELLGELAAGSGVGGRVLPNPLWRFLPETMTDLFAGKLGPVFTVHPLGGCAMGPDWRDGVVDWSGRVYRGRVESAPGEDGGKRPNPTWDDLIVLDGSIVPAALGTNPSLTIAALALHALEHLREKVWKWPNGTRTEENAVEQPLYRTPPIRPRTAETGTRFELLERLHGFATLESDAGPERCAVELTLRFEPFPITHITGAVKTPLEAGSGSTLRIFREKDWRRARQLGLSDAELSKLARVTAPLEGSLTVLRRSPSDARTRRWNAIKAWLSNRGVRDSWQWIKEEFAGTGTPRKSECTAEYGRIRQWLCQRREQFVRLRAAVCAKITNAKALASHAGEVRLFEYHLKVAGDATGSPKRGLCIPAVKPGAVITGLKRLTYAKRSNPWRQLQELALTEYPGRLPDARPPVLDLDTRYLGEQGVPLIRIVRQDDQPTALADLVALGAYLLRLMVTVHVWSFRMPDTPEAREPQRLPAPLPGPWWRFWSPYDRPRITELQVDELPDGTPVRVRLSRYARGETSGPPVVMIHGYSASGTTFAHPKVNPNLAAYFLARKREVWILDLRTSSGMPTARMPWTFEDAALVDIPAALGHIVRETRALREDDSKIDVIAHCMGSAMFSMAVLSWPTPGVKFYREREELPSWINRAVLSQVGPLVEFSPENILRGYVLSYIRHFLPIERYEFRTGPDPSLTDQLIDRLLATLPYPEEEFDFENPPWWQFWRETPWVGTRHRMDALYARDFSVRNLPRKVLAHIDDLFGPLSIETVSQGIHFARHKVITNRSGRNVYVTRRQLRDRWAFETLSVHGEENGLANVATLAHMSRGFRQAGLDNLRTKTFAGYGHQDSLIGRHAGKVFAEMASFLERGPEVRRSAARKPNPVSGRIPWIGPHLGTPGAPGTVRLRAAMDPGPNQARFAAFLPVTRDGERFVLRKSVYDVPDWSLVQLRHVPHDRDGWIRVDLNFSRAWLRETDAILMLFLYDEPDRVESALMSPEFKPVRDALRYVQFPAGFTDPAQKVDAQALQREMPQVYERLHAEGHIGKLVEYIEDMLKPVQQALNDALARKADELLPGLLEINKPPATAPQPALCFAFGSCQYPAGLLDGEVADRSMTLLSQRLDDPGKARPDFLLLLGDQVYVDATAGLFDPTALDDRYVRNYERLYLREGVQNVLRRLPAYMMMDDHEIDDNWEPGVDDVRTDRNLVEARHSYWRYQRFERFGKWDRERDPRLTFDFEHGKFPFFVADTRTRRMKRTAATLHSATIMPAADDFMLLIKWLDKWNAEAPYMPKFVASPAIVLPRHLRTHGPGGALRSDGWEGYPHSFRALLAHIAIERIQNVVFLSGDEHLSCIATAKLQLNDEEPIVVHSIHSSALYAPYPFANSDCADFPERDFFTFEYDLGRSVSCDVVTTFTPPGDGFTVMCIDKTARKLVCEFVRDGPGGKVELALADPNVNETGRNLADTGSEIE